jgi:CheY-like chemotaxis protein
MNAILGMGELLAEGGLNSQQQEYLQIMIRAGENLLSLIDDILDLSKMEAGFSLVERVTFEPRGLVLGIIEMFQLQATKKGLQLNSQISDSLPELILGDPRRLRQIITNLMGNALKFTESGGSVSLSLTVEGGDHLQFSIEDTGLGISAARQEQIFKPFVQAEEDTAKKYGGSGLGLSICQRLIHNMGGDLKVKSVLGQGSDFSFSLPLVQAEPQPGQKVQRASREDRRRVSEPNISPMGLHILVADDSPDNLVLVKAFLKEITATIQLVENGYEAVEAFKNSPFDIILMDMEMPVMGGLAATRQIRELEKKQGRTPIPIIAFSANDSPEKTGESLDAGCTLKLDKPVKKRRMVDVITQCIKAKPRT